jgi:hypothetical protein
MDKKNGIDRHLVDRHLTHIHSRTEFGNNFHTHGFRHKNGQGHPQSVSTRAKKFQLKEFSYDIKFINRFSIASSLEIILNRLACLFLPVLESL